MTVKILDCTLRDGGYYNNWDFDPNLVSDYLHVMSKSGIDYVELGLRQLRSTRYLGAHAYTTTKYIDRLELPKGPTYGVMIDAKTVLQEDLSQEKCIDKLFLDAKKEKIKLVRVAAHFREVSSCQPMLIRLKEKGYLVGLNIMQASLRKSEELTELAYLVNTWKDIDVLYFADSLGSMFPEDVQRVYNAISDEWAGEVGFHAHNNIGQALGNVNSAIDLGCTWIDSTVTGMGRGAGNAETEYLLEQVKLKRSNYDSSFIFNLVTKYFEILKKEYGWGTSIAYFHGAMLGLHPTFVQELSSDATFDKTLLPKVLRDLGKIETPHKFDKDILEQVKSKLSPSNVVIKGEKVKKIFKGKEILLVAQTNQSIKFKTAIVDYLSKKNPVLISINQPLNELDLKYDLVAISHNEKYRKDIEKYQKSKYKYIAPKKIFLESDINIEHNYGVWIKPNTFETHGSYACIPFRLTLAYAIAFCIDAGAESIKLAGFGGFFGNDPRQKEMQIFLNILSSNKVQILSLTPTTFTIPEESIYAI